jgi:glutamate racemase
MSDEKIMNKSSTDSIGIFDSGVGGLSVLRVLREQMPNENVVYFGDQGHVPYGARPMEEIQKFSEGITQFLLEQNSKIIVVACNTASAAALKYLREKFPHILFVGMEPAVKPAAEATQTGKVGVLATPATFQGALYASVVERFGAGVELIQNTCPGLVSQIEKGELATQATRQILEEALFPMLEKKIDTVVLGCTHYPFVIPLIQEIVGENVRVIDPAPAVVRQTGKLLDMGVGRNTSSTKGDVRIYSSGDITKVQAVLPVLLGENLEINPVVWIDEKRIALP